MRVRESSDAIREAATSTVSGPASGVVMTLREALHLVSAAPGPAARAAFSTALRSSSLLVPITRDSTTDLLKLLVVRSPEDRPLMLAFTDLGALREWSAPDREHIEMPAVAFLADASRAMVEAVYIDPKSPNGLRIPRSDIVALVEGLDPDIRSWGQVFSVPEGKQRVSAPAAGEFVQVIDAARRVGSRLDAVHESFVLRSKIGEGEAHPLVGLRFDEHASVSEKEASFAELRRTLEGVVRQGAYVDFMEFAPAYAAKLRDDGIMPIYSRGRRSTDQDT